MSNYRELTNVEQGWKPVLCSICFSIPTLLRYNSLANILECEYRTSIWVQIPREFAYLAEPYTFVSLRIDQDGNIACSTRVDSRFCILFSCQRKLWLEMSSKVFKFESWNVWTIWKFVYLRLTLIKFWVESLLLHSYERSVIMSWQCFPPTYVQSQKVEQLGKFK